jgi:uncharacterized protein YbjT (DUF2867 family)
MNDSKIIFIAGATGNQGGAVARNLVRNGFSIKALTRNPASAKAQKLKEINAEIIKGDLDDPDTYRRHLKGVRGVFCVLGFENGKEKEIQQGITLANLAKENAVSHFLYSSVIGCDLRTGVPHWESKFVIENHIKKIGLPYTIIRPAALYENFLIPQVRSRLLKDKLVLPADKNKVQQYISVEDIGRISTTLFMNPETYTSKTINLAVEQMDGLQLAGTFSKVSGKETKYQKLPKLITRLAMGKDLYKMFRWINENDVVFVKDLNAFKKEFPGLLSLEEWIRLHFK